MFLFVPGAGPFRFFIGSPFVIASALGAGVELDSEAASVEASTLRVGMSLVAAGGVGASDEDGFSSWAGFSSNWANFSGARRRMTILEPFLPLSDLGVEMEGDRVAFVAFDMMEVDDVMNEDRWEF